jgi:hypothetical protein
LSTSEALPDTASLHAIREELESLESAKEGQKDAREGRTKSQDEVEHHDDAGPRERGRHGVHKHELAKQSLQANDLNPTT